MHTKYDYHQNVKRGSLVENPSPIIVNEFSDEGFQLFFDQFSKMEKSGSEIIPIIVDSNGGELYSLFDMLSIISSSKVPVATITLGKAFSCGAILASAGTPGYRFIGPYGSILIHQMSLGDEGKINEIQSTMNHANKLNKDLFQILDKNAGKESGFFSKKLKSLGNSDFYLKANEAKKIGLVDKVGVPTLNVEITQKVTLKLDAKKKQNKTQKENVEKDKT